MIVDHGGDEHRRDRIVGPAMHRPDDEQRLVVGKVVLINFWASWCAPCRVELPALDSLAQQVDDPRFAIVTINEDSDTAAGRAFALERRFSFAVLLGGGRMRARYHYAGLPYSVLVDRAGRVVQHWAGFAGSNQLHVIATAVAAELDRSMAHVHHQGMTVPAAR